tara:strand:- start:1639 stop:1962 length:324 start_codon:yes stop_codon:yes gene_type:complete
MDDDSEPLIVNERSDDIAKDIQVSFTTPKKCSGTLRFEDDDLVVKIGTDIPVRISYFKIICWRHSRSLWGVDYKDSDNVLRKIEVNYCDPPSFNRKILEKVNYFLNM